MIKIDRQLKRIGKIRDEARDSVEYKVESAKLAYSEQICERLRNRIAIDVNHGQRQFAARVETRNQGGDNAQRAGR